MGRLAFNCAVCPEMEIRLLVLTVRLWLNISLPSLRIVPKLSPEAFGVGLKEGIRLPQMSCPAVSDSLNT